MITTDGKIKKSIMSTCSNYKPDKLNKLDLKCAVLGQLYGCKNMIGGSCMSCSNYFDKVTDRPVMRVTIYLKVEIKVKRRVVTGYIESGSCSAITSGRHPYPTDIDVKESVAEGSVSNLYPIKDITIKDVLFVNDNRIIKLIKKSFDTK